MVVLVMFSYQGDNIKEALQLASLLDSWLGHRHCSVSQLHLSTVQQTNMFIFMILSLQSMLKDKSGKVFHSKKGCRGYCSVNSISAAWYPPSSWDLMYGGPSPHSLF